MSNRPLNPEELEGIRRLLDGEPPPPELSGEAASLAEALDALALVLTQAGRAALPAVPASLRARVRALAAEALVPRAPWWRRALLSIQTPAGRWAVAGAAAAIVLALGVSWRAATAPIGRVDFTADRVTVAGVSHHGEARVALHRGDRVATSALSGGMITLGEGTRVALDAGTELELASADEIRLVQGRLFLRVSQAPGLVVRVGETSIRDIGTVFGVDLTSGRARIDVTEGAVEIRGGGQVTQAAAGQFVDLGQSLLTPLPRPGGEVLPGWVMQVLEAERRARLEEFVPSAGGL